MQHYMREYNFERPDSDYAGYDRYFSDDDEDP